jgi:hypothetical protein
MDLIFKIYNHYGILVPSYAVYSIALENEMNIEMMLISFAGLSPVEDPSDVLSREMKEALVNAIAQWFDVDFLLGFAQHASLQKYLYSKIDKNGRIVRVPLGFVSTYSSSALSLSALPDPQSQELIEATFTIIKTVETYNFGNLRGLDDLKDSLILLKSL